MVTDLEAMAFCHGRMEGRLPKPPRSYRRRRENLALAKERPDLIAARYAVEEVGLVTWSECILIEKVDLFVRSVFMPQALDALTSGRLDPQW